MDQVAKSTRQIYERPRQGTNSLDPSHVKLHTISTKTKKKEEKRGETSAYRKSKHFW